MDFGINLAYLGWVDIKYHDVENCPPSGGLVGGRGVRLGEVECQVL